MTKSQEKKEEEEMEYYIGGKDKSGTYVLIMVGFKTRERAQQEVDSWYEHPEEHMKKRFRKHDTRNEWGDFGDENGNPEPIIDLYKDIKVFEDKKENLWWNISCE